jgi:hypothetical protein
MASGRMRRNPAAVVPETANGCLCSFAVQVNSPGFRTDLMLRLLEGGKVTDHRDYHTVHSPQNPAFWWGNFLLIPEEALRDEAGR